jgi:hypothetical protein
MSTAEVKSFLWETGLILAWLTVALLIVVA